MIKKFRTAIGSWLVGLGFFIAHDTYWQLFVDGAAAVEMKRLLAIEEAAQAYREMADYSYRGGNRAPVLNNAPQQALWRALDTPNRPISCEHTPCRHPECVCGASDPKWEPDERSKQMRKMVDEAPFGKPSDNQTKENGGG